MSLTRPPAGAVPLTEGERDVLVIRMRAAVAALKHLGASIDVVLQSRYDPKLWALFVDLDQQDPFVRALSRDLEKLANGFAAAKLNKPQPQEPSAT